MLEQRAMLVYRVCIKLSHLFLAGRTEWPHVTRPQSPVDGLDNNSVLPSPNPTFTWRQPWCNVTPRINTSGLRPSCKLLFLPPPPPSPSRSRQIYSLILNCGHLAQWCFTKDLGWRLPNTMMHMSWACVASNIMASHSDTQACQPLTYGTWGCVHE